MSSFFLASLSNHLQTILSKETRPQLDFMVPSGCCFASPSLQEECPALCNEGEISCTRQGRAKIHRGGALGVLAAATVANPGT